MSLISSITDSTITIIGKGIAKRVLHAMGEVTHFSFDSVKCELILHITFKGEEDTTSILLGDYMLRERDGVVQLKFERIVTSKEWLNVAAEKFFQNRYLDVPDHLALEVRALFGDRMAP